MSVAAYAIAVGALAVVLAGVGLAARAARIRLLPEADLPLRILVTAGLLVGFLVVLGEALGTADALRRGAVVITSAVLGVVGLLVEPLPAPRRLLGGLRHHRPFAWTRAGVIAAVCVALVLAESFASLDNVFHNGYTFIDAIEYHLTWASHFATTHSTRSYIHVLSGDATSYYPLNDELQHGIAMLLVGRDSLSMLLALGDLALLLLAAYCIGAQLGAGAVAVCAVTPVAVTLASYSGQAINDWASLWPYLTAVAVLVASRHRSPQGREALVLGVLLGLGSGTKVDLLIPTLALSIAVIWLARGRRWSTAALLLTGGLLTGGYWYLRNWIVIGSPAPTQHIPGLTHVPTSLIDRFGFSVGRYLFNASVWRHFFVHGLRLLFGVAWPTVLLLAAWGVVAGGAVRRGRVLLVLALVTVAAAIGYVVTPTTAFGPRNEPFLFEANLRYAFPALLLGSVLVAATALARRWAAPVCLLLLAIEVVVVATGSTTWPSPSGRRPAVMVAVALVVVAATALLTSLGRQRAVVAGLVVVALIVGYPLQQYYLRHRYVTSSSPQLSLYRRLANTRSLRIGVVGYPAQYPFLGPQWRNTVHYVGQLSRNHSFEDYATCPSWRLAAAAYQFVVVEPANRVAPPALAWTRTDPAAADVFHNSAGTIFRIGPGFGTAACAADASGKAGE